MGKTSTSITSDKRKTMPPRGRGKKSLMLDAIRAVCKGGEEEFLQKVVAIGLGGWTKPEDENEKPVFQQPNQHLLSLALNRIEPPLKPVSPMVDFEFSKDAKPHEQANQILSAVSDGHISPDIGQMLIASIKSMVDIEEYTDLKERIEKLEATLNGES